MKNATVKIVIICGVTLTLGLILSVYLFVSLNNTNELKREQILSSYFNNIHNGIQNEIDRNLNSLYAIREFYLADRDMELSEFCKYASYYTDNIKSIQALEWVPIIRFENRDSFELSMQSSGFEGFQIFTRLNDNIIRAEDRDVYYPVTFIQPFEGNEAALGFDPGSSLPIRQDAIDNALQSEESAASEIISIIQKNESNKAILVFVPILDSGNKKPIALVEGVYLTQQLIEVAIQEIELPQNIKIKIVGKNNSDLLYGIESEMDMSASLEKKAEIRIADKLWNLNVCYVGPLSSGILTPTVVLILVVLFTLLLVRIIYIFLTDNRKSLRKYVNELENKNRDLEQYAYVASHDLQEPLHSLQGLVSIIKNNLEESLDNQNKKYLDHISMATKRMSSLINNLLQYSRIGQLESPGEVDCNEIMNSVLKDLNRRIADNNVQIELNSELPVIWGYPEAIEQLFQNLISNGIKFQNEDSQPKIEISYELNKNQESVFIFKDNGIGFSKEHEKQIFVIFKRLHNRSKFPGTGIGLANCKKIVELHYGKIWVESAPGKGSTFFFTLNLKK